MSTTAIILWKDAVLKMVNYQTLCPIYDPVRSSNELLKFSFPTYALNVVASQNGGQYPDVYLAIGYDYGSSSTTPGYTLIAMSLDTNNGNNDVIIDTHAAIYDLKYGLINKESARILIDNYKTNPDVHIPTKMNVNDVLKGFVFEQREFLKVIINVVEVHFKLGYHLQDDPDQPKSEGYTLIMVGVKNGILRTEEGKVFDYCHPCPSSCPDNLDDL